MIKAIRLVNWRSHADTLLEFREGTNLLVGIMGAGKSSVLEGISFGLFGTFPALERRKLKLDDIVRLNEPSARIVLEFIWGDSNYRVERVIERSKKGVTTRAEIFKDNALVENGTTAVNTFIQNLISLDYDLFTRAIYSEQNNIDHFLNLDPRKRKEEIDTLLGLDRFETARTNIVSVINRFRTRRDALEERFSKPRLDELKGKAEIHRKERISFESRLTETESSLQTRRKELTALSAKFEAMKKARDASILLEKEMIGLDARISSLKKDLAQAQMDESVYLEKKKGLASAQDQRAKTLSSMKQIETVISAAAKEAGAIDARLKTISEMKSRLNGTKTELDSLLGKSSLDALQSMQKVSESAVLSYESERKSLEQGINELENSLKHLDPGLSVCPLCSSKLTEDGISHVRAEKESLIATRKSRVRELSAKIESSKKENEALLSRIRKASLLMERLALLERDASGSEALQAKKAETEAQAAKTRVDHNNLQRISEALGQDSERLRAELKTMDELRDKGKELALLEAKLSSFRERMKAIEFDEKAFESARNAIEQLRLEAERLDSAKQSLFTQFGQAKEMLALVESDLSSMLQIEKELKSLYLLDEQLSLFKGALLETQTSLRSGLTDAINSAMNEIWPIFYPYRNYRALRLAVSEKDYLFEVDDGYGWKPLETVASGGERASAALTLRVALAMVLTPKLSWLILDEPTHNLDSEAVELLSSALQTKVPEVVKQTFVITHDEAFMGSDFASSYRLMRDKARNGETKAEAI